MLKNTMTQSVNSESIFQRLLWLVFVLLFVSSLVVYWSIAMIVFLASLVATWLLAVMWPNGQVLASMLAELGESIREFVVAKYNTLVLFLFSKSSSQLSDVAHKTESEAEVQQSISQSGTKK